MVIRVKKKELTAYSLIAMNNSGWLPLLNAKYNR
jgi:hypothetical protein